MSALPHVDAAGLWSLLPVADAVDALSRAFASDEGGGPPRAHVEVPGGDLLLMPAHAPGGVGVKLVTVAPANPGLGLPLIHGLYVLFAADTLAPVATIDGAALTALRTAAVSALATRHLARPDASRLLVFGAGTQARSHVAALRAVRPITHVMVVARTLASAAALVEDLRAEGVDARTGTPASVRSADIVCTCTTSGTPVFDGTLLAAGTHVNAVGAYRPDARELDGETLRRGRVVVEDRAAAMAEAGDLLLAIDEGAITAAHVVADLRELVAGAAVRTSDAQVTVFKSVGLALEDLAVARAAVSRLR